MWIGGVRRRWRCRCRIGRREWEREGGWGDGPREGARRGVVDVARGIDDMSLSSEIGAF